MFKKFQLSVVRVAAPALVIAAASLSQAPAMAATTTYTYVGGNVFPTVNPQDGSNYTGGLSTEDYVIGSVTFAGPLAANLADAAVTPVAFSFSYTGPDLSSPQVIVDNTFFNLDAAFELSTDSSGNITQLAQSIFFGNGFFFLFYNSTASDNLCVADSPTECTPGLAITASTTGKWFSPGPDGVDSLNPDATPLPSTLPLFAGGLGLVGYLTKRRKRGGGQALAAG